MSDPTDNDLAISSNVVSIDGFKFTRKNTSRFDPKACQHFNLTLESNGEIVTCDDCEKQVSAYWSIIRFLDTWAEAWRRIKVRQKECARFEAAQVVLRAAKKVERAWRKRRSVPCCPHCRKAILPTDGFGERYTINKAMELRRRETAARQQEPQ